jgi:hypothetical protein
MWSIENDHFECLSSRGDIFSERVSIIHPRTFFTSSILPSALNFFREIISFWGIGSYRWGLKDEKRRVLLMELLH